MSIALSDGVARLDLDPDFQWTDEFSWPATEQAVSRTLSGAVLIDTAPRLAGREITLASPDNAAGWISRADVEKLHAWEAADTPLALAIRGQTFAVRFLRAQGAAIEVTPVLFMSDPAPGVAGWWFTATLRFVTT